MVSYGDAGLLVQGGPNSGMLIPLSGRPVTVGRRADNDVVIDEITVSRKHVLIMETPSGYVLRDLNTTNGTFLNRVKVGVGEQLLKHGDTIRLAGSQITLFFRHEGSDTQKMGIEAPATGAIRLDLAAAQTPGQPPQPQPVAPCSRHHNLSQRPLCSRHHNLSRRPLCSRYRSLSRRPLCSRYRSLSRRPLCSRHHSLRPQPHRSLRRQGRRRSF